MKETLKKLSSKAVQRSVLGIDGYDRFESSTYLTDPTVNDIELYDGSTIAKLCAKQEDAISVELVVVNNLSKLAYYDRYTIHSNQDFVIKNRVEELKHLSVELYGYNMTIAYMQCKVIPNQNMVENYRQFVMSTVDRLDLDVDVPKYLNKKEMALMLKDVLKRTLIEKSASAISLRDYIELTKYEDCESHIKLVDIEKREYIQEKQKI